MTGILSQVTIRDYVHDSVILDSCVELGYNSAYKGVATLFASSCMFTPPITSIFRTEGWLMINVKSRYLYHEVAADKFCRQAVTRLNYVTSDFCLLLIF